MMLMDAVVRRSLMRRIDYYNELSSGVDEDTLTISPEVDIILGAS